eukprot:scaffold5605_cov128-Cylindrotheca_fusiformis.AAC.9
MELQFSSCLPFVRLDPHPSITLARGWFTIDQAMDERKSEAIDRSIRVPVSVVLGLIKTLTMHGSSSQAK